MDGQEPYNKAVKDESGATYGLMYWAPPVSEERRKREEDEWRRRPKHICETMATHEILAWYKGEGWVFETEDGGLVVEFCPRCGVAVDTLSTEWGE